MKILISVSLTWIILTLLAYARERVEDSRPRNWRNILNALFAIEYLPFTLLALGVLLFKSAHTLIFHTVPDLLKYGKIYGRPDIPSEPRGRYRC